MGPPGTSRATPLSAGSEGVSSRIQLFQRETLYDASSPPFKEKKAFLKGAARRHPASAVFCRRSPQRVPGPSALARGFEFSAGF